MCCECLKEGKGDDVLTYGKKHFSSKKDNLSCKGGCGMQCLKEGQTSVCV